MTPLREEVLQGGLGGRELEAVAQPLGPGRQHLLALEQERLGQLAQQQPQGKARDRSPAGPAERPPEGLAGPAAVVGVGAALAAAQARLRGDSSLQSWAAVQDAIRAGGPSLLFLYSDT